MEGDIVESGVFRRRSLLATALLLKELGSSKLVYGYDSFKGFSPVYHENDDVEAFELLHNEGIISSEHFAAVQKNRTATNELMEQKTNKKNLSKSDDFSDTRKGLLEKKLKLLNLGNVVLFEGDLQSTMTSESGPKSIFFCMMDCDLYQSYVTSFKLVWPKLIKGGLIYLDEYFSLNFSGGRIGSGEFLADKNCNLQMCKSSNTDLFERWFVTKTG